MAAIVYLDVDDEITSAAARIRAPGDTRLLLVVPFGSRLATSRINFRLLAREANLRGRTLSIVAGDSASRALAASAGLPVFSTVGEYEASADTPVADASSERRAAPTQALAAPVGAGSVRTRKSKPAPDPDDDPTATILIPPIAVDEPAPAAEQIRLPMPPVDTGREGVVRRDEILRRDDRASLPVIKSRGRFTIGRTAGAIGLALVALALVAGGVGAYVFLPSATVVVRPVATIVGPIDVDVRADPEATTVDIANGVVPAERLAFDLRAADTFPASGERVEAARATGSVTFDSINTVGPVAVPEGTRVSTLDGVVFATTQAVTVPAAKVAGNRINHGLADAPVRAQRTGPGGNVEAGEITQVPGFLDTQQVSVRNGAPMSGGVRNVFPQVTQEDVDKALADLSKRISEEFTVRLADPETVPAGMTLFRETGSMTEPVPEADPAALVGTEVPTFELAMTARGDVTVVDATPVSQVAEAILRSKVRPGYSLVADSVRVSPGQPAIEGTNILFPVVAEAREIRIPDAAALREEIVGLPVDEARARLAEHGDVEIVTWPEWVTSIPTIDFRLEVQVESDVTIEEAGTSPSPASP